jgi:hypothetical protein
LSLILEAQITMNNPGRAWTTMGLSGLQFKLATSLLTMGSACIHHMNL